MTKPKLIAMCGYPSSGKTAVAVSLSKASGLYRVSTDVIRDMLFPEINEIGFEEYIKQPDYNDKEFRTVWKYTNLMKNDLLKRGKSVVFDSSALNQRVREIIFDVPKSVEKYLLRLLVDRKELESRERHRRENMTSIDMWDRLWQEPTKTEARELGYKLIVYPNNNKRECRALLQEVGDILS